MATCPNKNLDSWKQLVANKGEAMVYYLWDKNNGNVDNILLQIQGGQTISSKASPKTLRMVRDLLKRIGVDYQSVSSIRVNGLEIGANGVADITQKLVQIVQGKEDVALPEEAMHFAVEIIRQTNPKLYQQLLKEINGHPKLDAVIALYGNDPDYQLHGKRNYLKLKEEAIFHGEQVARVLAERFSLSAG